VLAHVLYGFVNAFVLYFTVSFTTYFVVVAAVEDELFNLFY
jgi:hypothetical protein